MQAVYWGIGTHFGIGCSQSADGDYLGHVTNVAKASRGYTTDRELHLHTDSAEIVGLLCIRDAKEGGLSIYSSSLKVREIIEREHPESCRCWSTASSATGAARKRPRTTR